MGRADEGRLRVLAATVAEAAGYDVEELVVVAAGRRRLVRIIIDGDNGVSLDAAAQVSRQLAAQLDALDESDDNPMGPAPYTLEVTSPGIGRPLTEERHFRRARGRLLDLTLSDGTSLVGRVRRVLTDTTGEAAVELLIDRDSTVVPLSWISRAKVEVEFGRMPASHAAILDADGFVDPARVVDIDDDSGDDTGEDAESVEDGSQDDSEEELTEFGSMAEFIDGDTDTDTDTDGSEPSGHTAPAEQASSEENEQSEGQNR